MVSPGEQLAMFLMTLLVFLELFIAWLKWNWRKGRRPQPPQLPKPKPRANPMPGGLTW